MTPRPMPTHTYFIEETGGEAIKIGATRDPIARLRTLQSGNPRRLVLIGLVADPELERLLHRRFADYKISGEWFSAYAPGLRELARGCGAPAHTADCAQAVAA